MDWSSQPVAAASHGCGSGTVSDRAPAVAWSSSNAGVRDGHVLGTPVAIGGAPTGWLAVVSRRAAPSPRLARQAARATAPVLAALSRIDSLTREQQRAVRAALLDEMLEPHALRGRAAIAARAGSLGIDFAIPARVVLICPRRDAAPADADDGLAQALDALTEALAERSVASLSTRRQRAVTALVQAPHDDLRAELVQLTDAPAEARRRRRTPWHPTSAQ